MKARDKSKSTTKSVDTTQLRRVIAILACQHDAGKAIISVKHLKGHPDSLTIFTASSTEKKYKARDRFFKEKLGATIKNISGKYAFHVNIKSLLQSKLVQAMLAKPIELTTNFTSREYCEVMTLHANDVPVANIIFNNAYNGEVSVNNFATYPLHRGFGYGSALLEDAIDMCIQRGYSLVINVDKPRSETDDPMTFYKKALAKQKVAYKTTRSHATKFFDCQCDIAISWENMVEARFPGEYKESGLSRNQFLAVKYTNASKEEIEKIKPFPYSFFVALAKGTPVSALTTATPTQLDKFAYNDEPLIKDCGSENSTTQSQNNNSFGN